MKNSSRGRKQLGDRGKEPRQVKGICLGRKVSCLRENLFFFFGVCFYFGFEWSKRSQQAAPEGGIPHVRLAKLENRVKGPDEGKSEEITTVKVPGTKETKRKGPKVEKKVVMGTNETRRRNWG